MSVSSSYAAIGLYVLRDALPQATCHTMLQCIASLITHQPCKITTQAIRVPVNAWPCYAIVQMIITNNPSTAIYASYFMQHIGVVYSYVCPV